MIMEKGDRENLRPCGEEGAGLLPTPVFAAMNEPQFFQKLQRTPRLGDGDLGKQAARERFGAAVEVRRRDQLPDGRMVPGGAILVLIGGKGFQGLKLSALQKLPVVTILRFRLLRLIEE